MNRTFAIGDIHGCFGAFQLLVERYIRLTKQDRLILLGDYIDRGSQSKQVLDYILDLIGQGFEIVPLMGNHEAMMLEAFENNRSLQQWLYNGGGTTLQSFGIVSVKQLDRRYIVFVQKLRTYYRSENCFFVHAGFDEDAPDPFLAIYHQLWYCREKYNSVPFINKLVVHGHCPVKFEKLRKHIEEGRNVLGIDTGCVYNQYEGYGRLTALDVNTLELFSVQATE